MTQRRPKGTGTIERCRGKFRPRLTLEEEGRISLGVVTTKAEAEAVLEATRADLQRARSRVSGGATLSDYGKVFLRRREDAAYRGIKADKNRWKVHVEQSVLASLPVAAITPMDIRDWVERLARRPAKPGKGHKHKQGDKLSRSTLQNALNLLRVALEAAVEDRILESNPARGVRLPMRQSDLHRAAEGDPWTWLAMMEIEALLAVVPCPERWVVQFAIYTGLRQGEQWNLELPDVRLDSPHPHLVVRYGGPNHLPPKNGRVRTVPLLERARHALQRWQAETRGMPNQHKLAFPSAGYSGARGEGRRGGGHRRPVGPPPHWEDWLLLSGVEGQTGIPISWHSLRHSCASMLITGSLGRAWSLEEIKEMLGHQKISTTERYAHLAKTALVRAAEATDAAAELLGGTVVEMKAREV